MQFNRYDIPGFREAVKAENDARDAAFLNLNSTICGVELRQITPRDFLILDHLGILFALKQRPDRIGLVKLVWMMKARWMLRIYCVWKVWRTPTSKALAQLEEYLEATFQDTPGGHVTPQIPSVSWAAYICQEMYKAREWEDERTMRTPLRVINQIINLVRMEKDPHYRVNARHGKIEADRLRNLNKKAGGPN